MNVIEKLSFMVLQEKPQSTITNKNGVALGPIGLSFGTEYADR